MADLKLLTAVSNDPYWILSRGSPRVALSQKYPMDPLSAEQQLELNCMAMCACIKVLLSWHCPPGNTHPFIPRKNQNVAPFWLSSCWNLGLAEWFPFGWEINAMESGNFRRVVCLFIHKGLFPWTMVGTKLHMSSSFLQKTEVRHRQFCSLERLSACWASLQGARERGSEGSLPAA